MELPKPPKPEPVAKRIDQMSENEKINALDQKFPLIGMLFLEGLNDMQVQHVGAELADGILGGKGTYSAVVFEDQKELPPEDQSFMLYRENKAFPAYVIKRAKALRFEVQSIQSENGLLQSITFPGGKSEKPS